MILNKLWYISFSLVISPKTVNGRIDIKLTPEYVPPHWKATKRVIQNLYQIKIIIAWYHQKVMLYKVSYRHLRLKILLLVYSSLKFSAAFRTFESPVAYLISVLVLSYFDWPCISLPCFECFFSLPCLSLRPCFSLPFVFLSIRPCFSLLVCLSLVCFALPCFSFALLSLALL